MSEPLHLWSGGTLTRPDPVACCLFLLEGLNDIYNEHNEAFCFVLKNLALQAYVMFLCMVYISSSAFLVTDVL